MYWRVFFYSLFLLLGALAGWFTTFRAGVNQGVMGLLTGTLLVALAWFVVDSVRGARLLAWLRSGDIIEPALSSGLWGEVADRARRLLKSAKKQGSTGQRRRLQFFWPRCRFHPMA